MVVLAGPVSNHGEVNNGIHLVDAKSEPVVLRGVSFGWHNWWPQFYNADAVNWLESDWNCTVVGAAMGVEPKGAYISRPEWSELLVYDVFFPTATLHIADDWVFAEGERGEISVSLQNASTQTLSTTLRLELITDDYQPVAEFYKPVFIGAGNTVQVPMTFDFPAPGFYRCTFSQMVAGQMSEPRRFNIGYAPEKIISPVDSKPDFQAFWEQTRRELNEVQPEFKMTLLKESSTKVKNAYHVSMKSLGGVTVEGYYVAPVKKGKYPVIVSYMGYGSNAWIPDTKSESEFAQFVLSVRGQGLQMRTNNPYGRMWITHGLESKETYYYRGAFMDLVRAIDFVASRPEVDASNIFAEGGSQGGAFTMVACALDNRIKAAAPNVPFLSDYKDYFRIVNWPRGDFEQYLRENQSATWEHIYDVLSYFDVKNFARQIKCPLIMGIGLQDETCPPHTNFSGYNLITTPKEYRICSTCGHNPGREWNGVMMDFFRKEMTK